jgi:hypothetical protein
VRLPDDFSSCWQGRAGHSGTHSRFLLDGNIMGDINTTFLDLIIDVIMVQVNYSFSISISLTTWAQESKI